MRQFLFILLALFIVSFSYEADAARVLRAKSKGKSVMVQLTKKEMKAIKKGDVLFIVRGKKKRGSVVIRRVKGNKAIGRVTKGRAKRGDRLVSASRTLKKAGEIAGSASADDDGDLGSSKLEIGGLVGFGLASQTVETNQGSLDQSGSGIGFKAFGDFNLLKSIGVRGQAGLEAFNVETEADIGNGNETLTTEISYMSIDVLIRYKFLDGKFSMWAAGGLGVLVPMSQTSGTLDEGSISSTSTFIGQLGLSLRVGKKMTIPLQFEYIYFPPSEQVSSTLIAIRTGIGFKF